MQLAQSFLYHCIVSLEGRDDWVISARLQFVSDQWSLTTNGYFPPIKLWFFPSFSFPEQFVSLLEHIQSLDTTTSLCLVLSCTRYICNHSHHILLPKPEDASCLSLLPFTLYQNLHNSSTMDDSKDLHKFSFPHHKSQLQTLALNL